ncbi:hypothetical protein SAMN04488029_3190 [Reichenbachiella faecimaris]|uniref:Uncharacterized protein n=1 Tax=Reichenbachiella faecimaris TaxID=692418 RepID=A0A1W2GKJ3_REIFA|nr:TMF family protein [Reichenbachiella faecimaris]SMD37012.1 hypothetical protein SAMN04488029_3190 [Reichenbachiella faecimaris]
MKKLILLSLAYLMHFISYAQWNEVGKISTTSTGTIGSGNFSNSYIYVSDGSQKMGIDPNQIYAGQDLNFSASTFIKFLTEDVERLRISQNGNIGIGVTNPINALHLANLTNDGINLNSEFRLRTSSVSNNFVLEHIADEGNLIIRSIEAGDIDGDLIINDLGGNVGIGVNNPLAKLSIQSSGTIGSGDYQNSSVYLTDGSQKMGIDPNQIYAGQDLNFSASTFIKILTADVERLRILQNGSVGIGTSTTGTHKLAVEGSIGAREIKVEASGWSDFVFYDSYKLRSLEEVEEHINEKGHLPEIPSEAEVTENGVNLGEMDAKLLQKIEELTLYLIEQNKELKTANQRIEQLEQKISQLENE